MEQQVEIKIVTETISAQYGTLSVGSILRTGATYAAHLVNDCMAAKYQPLPVAAPTADDVQTSAQSSDAPIDDETVAGEPAGDVATGDDTVPAAAARRPAARRRVEPATKDES